MPEWETTPSKSKSNYTTIRKHANAMDSVSYSSRSSFRSVNWWLHPSTTTTLITSISLSPSCCRMFVCMFVCMFVFQFVGWFEALVQLLAPGHVFCGRLWYFRKESLPGALPMVNSLNLGQCVEWVVLFLLLEGVLSEFCFERRVE